MPERYSTLIERFNTAMHAYGLQKNTDVLLLALSGGRDSMLLLEMLHRNGWNMHAAHVNYGLRGDESDEDSAFVREVCARYKIPCSIYNVQSKIQDIKKGNLQHNARSLRYTWFEELRAHINAAAVVLAHHMADQTETFFLQAISGKPAKGMPEKRAHIVRPMLNFNPEEIDILIEHYTPLWREDSSNKTNKYRRNVIRNTMLPKLREHIADLDQIIFETCKRNAAAERLLNHWLKTVLPKTQISENEFSVELSPLLQLPEPAYVLHHFLHIYGFSYALCEQIALKLTSPEELHFSTARAEARIKDRLLAVNVIVMALGVKKKEPVPHLEITKVDYVPDIHSNRKENVVYLSLQTQITELHLRKRQTADYFYPSGMKGKKKLSDFFTDLKLSQKEKDAQWLLCCGNDIAWIVNRRISEIYKVKNNDTEAWSVEIIFDDSPKSAE